MKKKQLKKFLLLFLCLCMMASFGANAMEPQTPEPLASNATLEPLENEADAPDLSGDTPSAVFSAEEETKTAIDGLLAEMYTLENIPGGERKVSYSNNYETMEPEAYTAVEGTVTSTIDTGKNKLALGNGSVALLDKSPYLSSGYIRVKFSHDFITTDQYLHCGVGVVIKGLPDDYMRIYMDAENSVGSTADSKLRDWVLQGNSVTAPGWENIKGADKPIIAAGVTNTLEVAYYKDKLILALNGVVFFNGTSAITNQGTYENALGQFGFMKRQGAANYAIDEIHIEGVGTTERPAPPAINYEVDYETPGYAPHWSGATAAIKSEGENHFLQISSGEIRVADLDSPSIANGTLSFDYRVKDLRGFAFGFRYAADAKAYQELGWDHVGGMWVMESPSGWPTANGVPVPVADEWHNVMLRFDGNQLTYWIDQSLDMMGEFTWDGFSAVPGKFGLRLRGATMDLDNLRYTNEMLEPDPIKEYSNDFQQGIPGEWENAELAVLTLGVEAGANKVLKLTLDDHAQSAVLTSAPAVSSGTYLVKLKADSQKLGLTVAGVEIAYDGDSWDVYEGEVVIATFAGTAAGPEANAWNYLGLQFSNTEMTLSVNGETSTATLSEHALFTPGQPGVTLRDGGKKIIYVDDFSYTELMLDMDTTRPTPPSGNRYEEYFELQGTYPWTGASSTAQENGKLVVVVPANTVATDDGVPSAMTNGFYQMKIWGDKPFAFQIGNAVISETAGAWFVKVGAGAPMKIGAGDALSANKDIFFCTRVVEGKLELTINGKPVGAPTALTGYTSGTFGVCALTEAVTVMVDAIGAEEISSFQTEFATDPSNGWASDHGLTLSNMLTYNAGAKNITVALGGLSQWRYHATPVYQNARIAFDFTPSVGDVGMGGRYGFLARSVSFTDSLSVELETNGVWRVNLGDRVIKTFPTRFSPLVDECYRAEITMSGPSVGLKFTHIATNTITDMGTVFGDEFAPKAAGTFGLKSWGSAKSLVMDNLHIVSMGTIPILTPPIEYPTITHGGMTVTVDDTFPRILSYELGGKTINGQLAGGQQLLINGAVVAPAISFAQTDDKASYTITVPDKAILSAEIRFDAENTNTVVFEISKIQELGEFKVRTISFGNNSFLAADSTVKGGGYAWFHSSGGWHSAEEELSDDLGTINRAGNQDVTFGIVCGGGLAGAMETNSMDGARRAVMHKTKTPLLKGVSLEPGIWTYRHSQVDDRVEQDGKLWCKVAITADANGDGKADWQDGAVAYRENIMTPVAGSDVMKNNMIYIPMNFASQANDPFLNGLDVGKALYNYTDGFGQMLLEKGYQAEGHDDDIPSYSNVGVRQGGAKDFNYLIDEGDRYNISVGVHINATEFHRDANELYYPNLYGATDAGYKVDRLSKNWDWIDPAFYVNQEKDVLTGELQRRISDLYNLTDDPANPSDPTLDFIYVDVYTGNSYNAHKLVEYVNDLGMKIGTEFAGALEPGVVFTHWGNDLGYPNQGNSSMLSRMVKNDTDIFVGHALFKGNKMPVVSLWGDSKTDIQQGVEVFFNEELPTKFMKHYDVLKMETDQITFDGGVTSVRNASSGMVELRQKNVLVSTWKDTTTTTSPGEWHAGQADSLIPWTWDVKTNAELPLNGGAKLYHWNTTGNSSTWTLTDYFKDVASFDLYELTQQGRVKVDTVAVANGRVTIESKKNTPYVMYPSDGADPSVRLPAAGHWGEGSPALDFGFNSGKLGDGAVWQKMGDAEIAVTPGRTKYSVVKEMGQNRWECYAKFNTQGGTISQTMQGLIPGEDYTVGVWTESTNGRKSSIEVTIGGKTYTNYVTGQDGNHVSSFKYRNTNWQRMNLEFKVPAGVTTAELKLTAASGADTVSFDDVKVWQHTTTETDVNHTGWLVYEDFENVYEGWGPFEYIKGSLQTAIATDRSNEFDNNPIVGAGVHERGPVMTWVLDGENSLKSNETTMNYGFFTNEGSVKLKPNTKYTMEFIYTVESYAIFETYVLGNDGSQPGVFSNLVGDGVLSDDGKKITMEGHPTQGDKSYHASITVDFTTGDAEQSRIWFRSSKIKAGFLETTQCSFVIDNFSIREFGVTPPTPQPIPDGGGSWGTSTAEKLETISIRPDAIVKDGAALSALTGSEASKLVSDAKKHKSTRVVVEPLIKEACAKTTVEIPAGFAERLSRETKASLVVKTPQGSVVIPNAQLGKSPGVISVTLEQQTDGAVAISTGTSLAIRVELPALRGNVVARVESDGTTQILPKSVLKDGIALVGLTGDAVLKVVSNGKRFTDVGGTDWFTPGVDFVTSHELFGGVSENTFAPLDKMTRGMLVTVLHRMESKPQCKEPTNFTDVPTGSWYSDAVAWATETGITQSKGDNIFGSDDSLHRQELAAFIFRYAALLGVDTTADAAHLKTFSDAGQVSDWAKDAMGYAVSTGLLSGKGGGVLDPSGTATRAEVALVLQRFVEQLAITQP